MSVGSFFKKLGRHAVTVAPVVIDFLPIPGIAGRAAKGGLRFVTAMLDGDRKEAFLELLRTVSAFEVRGDLNNDQKKTEALREYNELIKDKTGSYPKEREAELALQLALAVAKGECGIDEFEGEVLVEEVDKG